MERRLVKPTALVNRGSGIKIDALPLAGHDALTNLVRRLLLSRGHQVGVVELFEAGFTDGRMLAFVAAVQAGVAHGLIATAVAGLLVNDLRDLGGKRKSMALHRLPLCADGSLDLVRRNQLTQGLTFGWRTDVVGRDV